MTMSEELFDIVKELFDWADIIDKSQGRAEVVMLNGSVFVDAAGEIIILRSEAEGLREERDDWQKACHKAWEELGRLTDEIERLRTAGDALYKTLNDNIAWVGSDEINAAWREARRG